MSTRISDRAGFAWGAACAVLFLLPGCSGPDDKVERDALACRVKGGIFEQLCTSEVILGADGTELVVRAPNGDFRRLLVTEHGRNVIAADGAEPLLVEQHGADSLYVSADGITYRLPVPVRL